MSDSLLPVAPRHVFPLVAVVLALPAVSVVVVAIFLNWGR